jgi:hypothetical protein
VVLKRRSNDVDVEQTAAFISHLRLAGAYLHSKFMGQRIERFDNVMAPRAIGDCFYAAAKLPPIALTSDGVNPVSGTQFPVNDPDAMEQIAFVAMHVRVEDPTDCEAVQPIVDMVLGKLAPKRRVAEELDSYHVSKRNNDAAGTIALARRLLHVANAATPPLRFQSGTSTSPASSVSRQSVHSRLTALLPAQLEELVFRLVVPQQYMSGAGTAQSLRVIELLTYCESKGMPLADIDSAIDRISGVNASDAPRSWSLASDAEAYYSK